MIKIDEDKPLTEGRFVEILNDRLGIKDDEYPVCLVLIEKHLLDSLKRSRRKGEKTRSITQEKKGEQERKKSDSPSEANDDLAFKPQPNLDSWMNKKSVIKFLGYKSTSTIDQKVKAGKFPKPEYLDSTPRWRESVVVNWREEKKERKSRQKRKNRSENTDE